MRPEKITSGLTGLSITQILREENTQANSLARLESSSESEIQGIRVEPSLSSPEGMEVNLIDIGPSWNDPIVTFLTIGNLLTEKTEAC